MARKKSRPVKPTAAEQKIIDARLRRMYPQMFTPVGMGIREKAAYASLSAADRKALERMVDVKLKKIYRRKK